MKILQILFALLLFCAFNSSFAQVNHPFPNKNGEWTMQEWGPEIDRIHKYYIQKDTLINTKVYSIISHQGDYFVRCALRTDSLKVYARNINDLKGNDYMPIDTNEYVLYDYGLMVGDRIKVANYFESAWITERIDTIEFEVREVDSVKINEKYRRRLKLFGGMNDQDWIDGIGSTISPIYQAFMTEFEVGFDLISYCEEGENIYGGYCKTDDVQNFTNPFKLSYNAKDKMLNINTVDNQLLIVKIINSMGRQVHSSTEHDNTQLDLSHLSKGYYIVCLRSGSSSYNQKIIIN